MVSILIMKKELINVFLSMKCSKLDRIDENLVRYVDLVIKNRNENNDIVVGMRISI